MFGLGAIIAELHPRITRNRTRLSAVAIYSILTCAIGTSTAVAVAASPACSQLIHTYVDRLERNRVTADTLKRWHDWGVGHPNWTPSLHARRPKYKKVRQDLATNEPISCPVFNPPPTGDISLLSIPLDTYLLPVDTPDLQPFVYVPANPTEASLLPPAIFPGGGSVGPTNPGGATGVVVPPTPPDTPVPMPVPIVNPEPIPEPNSIILTLTGIFGLGGFAFMQRKNLLSRQS